MECQDNDDNDDNDNDDDDDDTMRMRMTGRLVAGTGRVHLTPFPE